KVVEEPFALYGTAAFDVVPDADHRLVIGLELGATGNGLHEPQRVEAASNSGRIGRLQELFGRVGCSTHRSFGIAIEYLLGNVDKQFLGRLEQVCIQCRDGRDLAAEHERPGLQGLFDLDRKSTRLNSSHVKNSYAVF